MKKLLFLLLLSVSIYGQTLQNPTFGNTTTNTLKVKTPATVTSVNFLPAFDADGQTVSKIAPIDVNIPYAPTNYSASTQTIGNHLAGIDTKLGQISTTTTDAINALNANKESVANKSGTLTASSTLYPNNNAVIAGLSDKITIDDVYPLLGDSERIETVATELTDITDYLDLTAKGSGTAYYNGKNFYNTVWGSGNGTSLISQTFDQFDVSVTAGTYRSSSAVAKIMPIGTFTASVEVTVLTGSASVTPFLYIYRIGQGSPNVVPLTLSGGKYIGNITFTNTAEANTTMVVQHSVASATTAYTASIKMQIEFGGTPSAFESFSGNSITLSSSEFPIPTTARYIYPAGSASLTITRSIFTLETNNKVIDCWGDSLTEGAGSATGKPVGDINSDVSYPGQLSRMLTGYTVRNLGVGGETSWMIATRQGGMAVRVEPFTLPATTTAVRVFLSGIEQDYYYTAGNWTYFDNNLSYNFAVSSTKGVNPVTINGITGTLSRTALAAGSTDPDTGLTVPVATYAYYFTRSVAGSSITTLSPKDIVTTAKKDYLEDIQIIWMGQNDAPEHSGSYVLQPGSFSRARRMIEICKQTNKRYIVMNAPSGSNSSNATIDHAYALEFGSKFLNIRDYICRYGVAIASDYGYVVTNSSDNTYIGSGTIDPTYATVGASHAAGVIARNFRIDGVHGNYWYYYIVATALKEKGKDLGYW